MNIYQYSAMYGSKALENLAKKCGTSLEYMRQLKYGYRAPSKKLLMALVEHSNGELDIHSLMTQREWYVHRAEKGDIARPSQSTIYKAKMAEERDD